MNQQKCSVKGKIKCVFQPQVILSQGGKRNDQMYKVVASEDVSEDFIRYAKDENLVASEKFDGTCCYIGEFRGRPWLWARHDIKPNKPADKRFKAYQHSKNEHLTTNGSDEKYPDFVWDVENDFKEAPDDWVPASGADREKALPDDIGHIVGWVPVDPSLRQHLWHLSAVNLNDGIGLFLYDDASQGPVRMKVDQLEKHCGKTFELIGTHVNGNPYKLGCKKSPIHVLVQHGEFTIDSFPRSIENDFSHSSLETWFNEQREGHIEGVVWHADDGRMFKLHRHHLNLKWPVDDLRMFSRSIYVDLQQYEVTGHYRNSLFEKLKTVDGRTFESVETLSKWSIDSCS